MGGSTGNIALEEKPDGGRKGRGEVEMKNKRGWRSEAFYCFLQVFYGVVIWVVTRSRYVPPQSRPPASLAQELSSTHISESAPLLHSSKPRVN